MIVATMTSKEIAQVFLMDIDRVKAFASHREKELARELRKSRKEMVVQSYEYHTDNGDYILVLRLNKKGYVSRLRFAFIQETLEYVSPVTMGNVKGMMSYSAHLFRRYAERVWHDKSLPMKTVILKFTKDFIGSCIYYDGKRMVSACEQGICLGEYDEKRDLIIFKTFVSLDLLKDSQLMAWNKVEKYFEHTLEARRKYGLYSEECQKQLRSVPAEQYLSSQEAQEIYASFYNRDDISNKNETK